MVTPSEVTSALATKPPKRASAPGPDVPRIVPRRHAGRWLTAAVALLLFAMVLNSVVRNDAFQWSVVGRYFTTAAVLDGLLLSLGLTAVVMVLGFLLGTVLAVMRLSANPVLQTLSWGYVWIFRSTPLLVQLLFWFNIGALYPTLGLGIPFGPQFLTVKTVNLLGPTLTAVIGLADPTHTHRSGLLAVSPTDGHLIDPSLHSPHPRRIALGAPTNSRAVATFARPRTNAPAFRQNDAVAHTLLRALSATETGTATPPVDGRPLRV
ncbi:ABC transporter permease subunit [Streptomyces paradoxus]|uniref:ABC transporter permease subunit n=1 Tax=Streptomyces paradoxus TaxID=66375 RepID=UPI0036FB8B2B